MSFSDDELHRFIDDAEHSKDGLTGVATLLKHFYTELRAGSTFDHEQAYELARDWFNYALDMRRGGD